MPILSIVTAPGSFFDLDTGIYVRGNSWDPALKSRTGNCFGRGPEWERKVHLEFFEPDGRLGFSQDCGARIHGGITRREPQKSLKFYARKEYGDKDFDHQIFENRPFNEYKRFTIRAASTDWSEAFVQDHIAHQVVDELGFDKMAARPALIFLNGEYWGIQALRERLDKFYLEQHHDVEPDNVDLMNHWEVAEGDLTSYSSMLQYIRLHDLAAPSHYEYVTRYINIDNFIDYHIAEMYFANTDWPRSNIRYWRERVRTGKWRWMFYDLDAGLTNVYENTLLHIQERGDPDATNPDYATEVFRNLIRNRSFQFQLFSRMEDLLNTTFKPSRVKGIIEEVQSMYIPEIDEHMRRWNEPGSYSAWQEEIDRFKAFADERPCVLRAQVFDAYDYLMGIYQCGEHQVELANLSTYPNPSTGQFTLNFDVSDNHYFDLEITDIVGKVVYRDGIKAFTGANSQDLEVNGLRAGIYFLQLLSGDARYTQKLVIQKPG